MITIENLKNRLQHNKLLVQREDGYLEEELFTFHSPASAEELKKLPDYIPEELLSFFKKQNGAYLYESPHGGGGTQLFSISESLEYKDIWECPNHFFPIGCGLDGLWIVCQCIEGTKENVMWIGEFLNFEDEEQFGKLNIDYSTWLERFVIAQGSSFWEWS
ncbi:SMI1/KNR4 family protein [Evansella sp. AB-rgal1]|uniref:SMI1/KNR4 family protein n=1 Tax=Evansella sp. AB-rgal1 TaxID=3242696 RepID=UPI00359E5D33